MKNGHFSCFVDLNLRDEKSHNPWLGSLKSLNQWAFYM